ncbi:MAG: CAP domain-containing protein, partial [Candidatus Dojkabacteria bacterium]
MKELFIPTKKNNYKPYLLRKLFLASYTVILVVVNTFGGVLGISKIAASDINSATLISLTNQERTVAGLNTLNNNSLLVSAAQAKAQNMFEQQYWDHFGPNGETPWQFITASGYSYVYAG